ncbi:dmd-8, partial [Pristionchus pacificus]
ADHIMTMAAPQEASDGQAVTFFNIAKQIPKGVKRHCGMCRQHGVVAQTRNHACQFKNCECTKCNLVRQRRSIMSMQIRLRREQDKMFVRTTEPDQAEIVPPTKPSEAPTACYFCQKCKNHGVLKWKKDHKKNCAFANCSCGQCELIDTRRALDSHIKKGKKRAHNDDDSNGDFHIEAEMCASSMASSPTVSDGRTPSITEFELSQSLNALGYSALPELKMDLSPTVVSSFLTVVPSQTTTSNTQLLSTEMILQELALQAASLQGTQSTVSPTPCVVSPTVSTPTVIDNDHVDTVPAVQYLNLVHHQVQPTIYIQHPMLFSLQQNTVPSVSLGNTVLPALSQMDIHNIVSNLMLNTRG